MDSVFGDIAQIWWGHMSYYGFHSEFIELLNGREIKSSFFEKVYSLVDAYVKNHQKEEWKRWLISRENDLIREIGNDFVANYLFEAGNERVRYVFQQLDKTDNVDGLMVKFFKQYNYSFAVRNNPFRFNIRRRIREILKAQESNGYLIKCMKGKVPAYRRRGCPADENLLITEEDLKCNCHRFPKWERVDFKQEKKISPIISNEQLREQIAYIFENFSGWLSERTLIAFFSWYLNIPSIGMICYDQISEMAGNEIGPYESVKLLRDYERLTERQQKTFEDHYVKDRNPDEIASNMSLKKSTIYEELRKIKDTFQRDP